MRDFCRASDGDVHLPRFEGEGPRVFNRREEVMAHEQTDVVRPRNDVGDRDRGVPVRSDGGVQAQHPVLVTGDEDGTGRESDEDSPDLPVWGCFRTVPPNVVRHGAHAWVADDGSSTRYQCEGQR